MTVKNIFIVSFIVILAFCSLFSRTLASGSTPPNPPRPETPEAALPVPERVPNVVNDQEDHPASPPLIAPEGKTQRLSNKTDYPVEKADPPYFPEKAPALEDDLLTQQAGAGPVKAVLVRSFGDCSSTNLIWDDLNTNWEDYGSTEVIINYAYPGLCSGKITYAALAASGADVLIISDPAGAPQQYTAAEIDAIRQYAQEGHNLIGTYLLFQWNIFDNRALAPLFGLQDEISYSFSEGTPTYSFAEPANPLFNRMDGSFESVGYTFSQVPDSGIWNESALKGARIVATSADQKAAILSFHAPNYHATYITNMPEYASDEEDKQFIYNALTYDVIDAVVIRSWGGCSNTGLIWNDLNTTWPNYGPVPIHIRYAVPDLCSGTITYAALAASGADVLILSDPAGAPQQYTAAEIDAIRQYAQEGHNLIGTYILLQNFSVDNRGLAPLFGLREEISYTWAESITPTYKYLEPANPVFKHLSAPYASSGYQDSQVPESGTWSVDVLNGARIVGIDATRKAAILAFDGLNYRAVYISNMPEYYGGDADKQFFYNAIRYTVDAVLVRPWGACSPQNVIWDDLNANSPAYGSIPIHIIDNYHGLCDGTVTASALKASRADVLIFSNPGGGGVQFSTAEIEAVRQYALEGHHLVGTYGLFQWTDIDNRGLAPLFGLQSRIKYTSIPTPPNYIRQEQNSPLFDHLNGTYASSGNSLSQIPDSGAWNSSMLQGARIVGINNDQTAAILSYHGPNYHASYITNMPEYNGGAADRQFLYNTIAYDVIDAVIVRSFSPCSSIDTVWDNMNATWPNYGSTPIHIRYAAAGLCSGTITYAGLAASKADVLILSNPAGTPLQYSTEEIDAIGQYAQEGHNLIGTHLLFQWSYDNRGLTPLFGLQEGIPYDSSASDVTYNYLEPDSSLFTNLRQPYASFYPYSQVPSLGTWSPASLNGARIVGINPDNTAAIMVYDAPEYYAVYISSMPEYQGSTADKQFLYNAVVYPSDTIFKIFMTTVRN